jgi:DivIVA domain-containing protein
VSARRRLPSRLGCALGAGLRLLGSRRWWRTRWWRTRWSPRSATPRGRLYLLGWPGRRCRSRMCRVRAIASLRSFGWCWVDTSVLLVAGSLPPWPAPRLSPFTFALTDLRTGCLLIGPRGPRQRHFHPLTWRALPGKRFTTTRRLRPGYDPEQVDAFLDKAEPRLAAMRAADNGAT